MSIGKELSAAREAVGLTVEDVSARTRVRGQLLRAIESDDFTPCGGAVYARGHIKAYSHEVGLDPAPLMAEFDRTFGVPDEPPFGVAMDLGPAHTIDLRERRRLSWSGAGVVGAVAVTAIAVGSYVVGGGSPARPASVATANPAAPQPQTQATVPPVAPSVPVAALPTGVSVTVKALSGQSWIGLAHGTAYVFSVTLQRGQARQFHDAKQVTLRIGDPGAVDVTVNGRHVGSPGKSGQPVTVTYPSDGAAAAQS